MLLGEGKMGKKLKLGVLVSGKGSNLQNIMDNCQAGKVDATVEVVISDLPDAFALERARKAGIPALAFRRKDFASKEDFDQAILTALQEHRVELIVLAGYLRILTEVLVKPYEGRIMNIHPSLVPTFCGKGMHGLEVHRAALKYGVKITGVTVHFVELSVDTGPIILQRAVPVMDGDTPEILSDRVLEQEHEIYSEAIQLFAQGRLKVEGRWVRILEK